MLNIKSLKDCALVQILLHIYILIKQHSSIRIYILCIQQNHLGKAIVLTHKEIKKIFSSRSSLIQSFENIYNIFRSLSENIAPAKALFSPIIIDSFLISPRKHNVVVLIRSALPRHF